MIKIPEAERVKRLESQSKKYYHVTGFENEREILKNGLIPQEPYTEPEVSAIFLWDDLKTARRFADVLYEDPYVIFEVDMPPHIKPEKRICHPKAREGGFACEYLVREKIPPTLLKLKFRSD